MFFARAPLAGQAEQFLGGGPCPRAGQAVVRAEETRRLGVERALPFPGAVELDC